MDNTEFSEISCVRNFENPDQSQNIGHISDSSVENSAEETQNESVASEESFPAEFDLESSAKLDDDIISQTPIGATENVEQEETKNEVNLITLESQEECSLVTSINELLESESDKAAEISRLQEEYKLLSEQMANLGIVPPNVSNSSAIPSAVPSPLIVELLEDTSLTPVDANSPVHRSPIIVEPLEDLTPVDAISTASAIQIFDEDEIDEVAPSRAWQPNSSGMGDFWIRQSAMQENVIRNSNILVSRRPSFAGYSRALVPSINARKFRGIASKEYNILLLGQTGVGKSTFINAFYNYLKFSSLEEARNAKPEALIPCQFTLQDENYRARTVYFGSDDNERTEKGQSSTQTCRAYEFPVDNFVLRMIDTPGIGDTRGVQQDKSNLTAMLDFISNYDELYAICILLKPNESRLTPSFAFCIKQLLCQLHERASDNIIFVFTNSRSTFYRPGDTVTPLTEILDQIRSMPPYPDIPFAKENIFCLDNESFRFLIALHNNVRFTRSDFENFGQSWIKSVEESSRMIKLIVEGGDGMGAKPHLVIETVIVNRVRETIIDLCQPLSEMAKNIQMNLHLLNERKEEIEASNSDKNKLQKLLYLPQVSLTIKELPQPCTVCTGDKCRLPYKVGNLVCYHYPQKCHTPCYLQKVPKEIAGVEALRHCWAMNMSDYCRVCGCHYLKHLHVYYESEEIETQVVDSNVAKQLETKQGAIKAASAMVERLEEEIERFQNQEETLSKCVAKLAVYLKQNAMVVRNDSFVEHISQLIENEKAQNYIGAKNSGIIMGLQKMLKNYEKEKAILDKVMSSSASNNHISLEEVYDIIEKIKKMETIGISFTKAIACQTNSLSDSVKNFFLKAKKMIPFLS